MPPIDAYMQDVNMDEDGAASGAVCSGFEVTARQCSFDRARDARHSILTSNAGVGPAHTDLAHGLPTAVEIRGAALADLASISCEKAPRIPSSRRSAREAVNAARRSSANLYSPGALPAILPTAERTSALPLGPVAHFPRRSISRENSASHGFGLVDRTQCAQPSQPSSPIIRGSHIPAPPSSATRHSVSAPDSQAQQHANKQATPWNHTYTTERTPDHGDSSANISPTRPVYPQSAAHRATTLNSSPSSSPATSSPHTPREPTSMRPRPPGDSSGGAVRPKRPSLIGIAHEPSSLLNSPTAAGRPLSIMTHLRTPSMGGFDGNGSLSPSALSRASSRPGSGRGKGGVQTLFDAIRSKHENKLLDALDAFRLPTGGYAGLDALHAVTGKTALHEAVTMNSLPAVRLLLAAGANPNFGHVSQGPPILCAAACGEVEMVELLLESGAEISAVDSAGYSALHYACASGHVDTARGLLARKASPYMLTGEGETPLELAPDEVHEELLASFSAIPPVAAAASAAATAAAPTSTSSSSTTSQASSMLSLKAAAAALAAHRAHCSPLIPPSPPRSVFRLQSGGTGPSSPGKPPTVPLRSPGGSKLMSNADRSRPPSGLSTAVHPDSGRSRMAMALQIQASMSPPSSSEASPIPSSSGRQTRESMRSPLSEQDDKGPPMFSPVELQLPISVQMKFKAGGAGPSDISTFFEQQDAQQVKTQQPTTGLIFGIDPTQEELKQRQAAASGGSRPSSAKSPHLSALAAAVPITPKFRFGIDIYDLQRNTSIASSSSARTPAASPPHRSEDGGPPAFNQSSGSAIGLAITAAAGLVSESFVGGSEMSGADMSAAPPLLRVASPERSPRSEAKDDVSTGFRGGGGGGRAGPPSSKGGGVGGPDVVRISQAAQALAARLIGATTSTEALQAHATAMFKRSSEVQTGSIMWTRGELLGEGAFGKVYAGLNQKTGELMAVKAMALLDRKGNHMQAQLAELQQELEMYKKLSHKHVVGYIDSQLEERTSTLYIFLEYVPGGSIASMLGRFGKFSEELVQNYTRQLLLGLEYLHGRRIVHRDVKGGNVLVSRDGIVKLADFGASKANHGATITDLMKSLKGSVFWMAPEVITGVGYGRRADIWSLGCTVIEMMTGKHPWPEVDNQWTAMHQIASRQQGPPRPQCSELATDFLNRCLMYDPANRPTATELLQHPYVCTPEIARRLDYSGGGGKDLKRSV